ncbi:Ndufaf2 [Phodopus roborovskii]|uniref:Ndufaf2 protein n=1 Tax=Phodopus roborovskii TaxID=109678 RepID=A0AAU9Z6V4_PHORO|nr:Ndufaf2 [Phodopus roborovskii]
MGWWRGLLRSVWSSLSREVREHVGTDHLGNKYYYIAKYKNWRDKGIDIMLSVVFLKDLQGEWKQPVDVHFWNSREINQIMSP